MPRIRKDRLNKRKTYLDITTYDFWNYPKATQWGVSGIIAKGDKLQIKSDMIRWQVVLEYDKNDDRLNILLGTPEQIEEFFEWRKGKETETCHESA